MSLATQVGGKRVSAVADESRRMVVLRYDLVSTEMKSLGGTWCVEIEFAAIDNIECAVCATNGVDPIALTVDRRIELAVAMFPPLQVATFQRSAAARRDCTINVEGAQTRPQIGV